MNQLMPKEYKNVCDRLNMLTIKGAYDVLRCMTHEYLMKTGSMKDKNNVFRFTIVGVDNEDQYALTIRQQMCGLKLIRNKRFYRLLVYNARFIYDLNLAFEHYKTKLNSDIRGYRKYFLIRSHEIGLKLLN